MNKLDLNCIHLAEIITIDKDLSSSPLGYSLRLFSLLLSLPDFLLVSLLNLFSRQVIRILLNGLIGLPELVPLGLVSDFSPEASGDRYSLDLVIVLLELQRLNPLLVVEGEQDLDGHLLDDFEFVLGDLGAVEQPGQRGHDALQTLQLPVPLGSHHALIHLA